jgi:hypothetical protein
VPKADGMAEFVRGNTGDIVLVVLDIVGSPRKVGVEKDVAIAQIGLGV